MAKILRTLLPAAAALLSASSASAAITVFAEYHLGEAGSLGSNNLPQDSSGNARNFVNEISGATSSIITGGTATSAIGSTAYLNTGGAGNEGWYSPNLFSGLQTDNFAFGIFVRAASLGGTQGDIFTLGGSTGSYKISLGAGGWEASQNGLAMIAASAPFVADTWVHLALIRSGGVTTFYIDGTQYGSTYAGSTPINDTAHLSVNPGGGAFFDGGLDEARVLTFTAGESSANILSTLQVGAVPEPSTYGLMGAGALAAIALVRRRRKSL